LLIGFAPRHQGGAFDGDKALSTLLLMHDRVATTVMLYMFAVGFWGVYSYIRGESLGGSLAGALAIGQGLVVVQGLLGAALYLDGARAPSFVHYLYGATAILALPFAWSYLRDRAPRQSLLIFSLVSLFIGGLAIRGMTTGS